MSTDFNNKMNLDRPLSAGSKENPDMPLDVRTRVESKDEIAKIPFPYIGMLIYVKDEDKYYKVNSLKGEEKVPGVPASFIPDCLVDEYEEFVCDDDDEVIQEDIVVSGIGSTLGGLVDGQVIEQGTTFTEFVKILLQRSVSAIYMDPSLQIKLTPANLRQEVGTIVNPVIDHVFMQNDAGPINGIAYGPLNLPQQEPLTILDGDNIEYSVTINYQQGVQKTDNFGNPSGAPIQAGNLQAKARYVGFRYFFYGADTRTVPCANSAEVRSLTSTEEEDITLVVPVGSRRVTIAVPKNGKQPQSIKYVQQGYVDYLPNFVPAVVSVSGAIPGENMIDYNVYTYIFSIPCAASMTFRITMA